MFIWKADYQRLIDQLVVAKVEAAKYEAEAKALRASEAVITFSLEKAEKRNESIFDALMQVKFQHPGTGYQDSVKQMFQDGEMLMEEDPEELRKYHARMKELQDAGMDPGLVLLEDMDELRSESDVFGPGVSEGTEG